MAGEGAGNLLAGLAGTTPNTPFPVGVPVTELTRVAAGAVFIVLAFVPKALALILAIPGPAMAATIMVVMAMLFGAGTREVIRPALGRRGRGSGRAMRFTAGRPAPKR